MYEIDPKFLNPDGCINQEAAAAACLKARAEVAGQGFRYVWRGVRRAVRLITVVLRSFAEHETLRKAVARKLTARSPVA